jgi:hypothetical protein
MGSGSLAAMAVFESRSISNNFSSHFSLIFALDSLKILMKRVVLHLFEMQSALVSSMILVQVPMWISLSSVGEVKSQDSALMRMLLEVQMT